ncbi:MAG: hypothetical protein ABJD97_02705 [Betaproteobacteria bacterium]
MTRTTPNAADPSPANRQQPATLPRRARLGSAIASVLVSTLVIGTVVFGMTDMAENAPQFAAVSTSAERA